MSVHTSSARTGTGRDDWATPPELVTAIARKLDLRFALDTACESHNAIAGVRAVCAVDRGADGLAIDWDMSIDCARLGARSHRDAAWCNPPYSKLRAWLDKCAREGERCNVVALIPARTDTHAWHESVMPSACRVLLLKGRVKFVGASTGAPFPSAVVQWLPGYHGPALCESWDWRADVAEVSP
jgi:phage N-6-adenine-methyltransferase